MMELSYVSLSRVEARVADPLLNTQAQPKVMMGAHLWNARMRLCNMQCPVGQQAGLWLYAAWQVQAAGPVHPVPGLMVMTSLGAFSTLQAARICGQAG